jgi:hypothetical protein
MSCLISGYFIFFKLLLSKLPNFEFLLTGLSFWGAMVSKVLLDVLDRYVFGLPYKGAAGHGGWVFLAACFGLWFGFGNYGGACGNFWLYGKLLFYLLITDFFWFYLIFWELFPAIRCNLLCRTPAQKDFHCYRG